MSLMLLPILAWHLPRLPVKAHLEDTIPKTLFYLAVLFLLFFVLCWFTHNILKSTEHLLYTHYLLNFTATNLDNDFQNICFSNVP